MKRLGTLAILTSLGAAGPLALGDEAPAPAPAPATQPADPPEPPASPRSYLKTAAELFNRRKFEPAARYLAAAQMYRDRLTPQERIVLDVYRDMLARYNEDKAKAATSASASVAQAKVVDRDVVVASTTPPKPLDMTGKSPAPGAAKADDSASLLDPGHISTDLLRGTADSKQRARWLLHQAREQIVRKKFDAAERFLAEARAIDIKWGFLDDTPDKVMETLTKARAEEEGAKDGKATGLAQSQAAPRDRRAARAKLREARQALAAADVDRADAIAREVQSWGLRYGLLDDTPEKVAAAAAEARRRAGSGDPAPR